MSDEAKELTRSLPSYFPIDEGSNNYRLLKAAGKAVGQTDDDIGLADKNTTVQTATSIENLFELAKLVDLPPRTEETLEEYRVRAISEFQLNTSGGTAEDLITSASIILDVRPQSITYRDADENGVGLLGVPRRGLKSLDINESDFVERIQRNTAGGYRVEAFQLGTFEYRDPDDYHNDENIIDYGYDGLDEGGNPTGEGGTYAGLLE